MSERARMSEQEREGMKKNEDRGERKRAVEKCE